MRFIQVGLGSFGKRWMQQLLYDPRAEPVALVDVSPENLEAAREEAQMASEQCFPTLEKALEKVEAEAVVCVTPPEYHREVVTTAMKAGLHAITEKPMAHNLEDCLAILKTARETGKTCVVSQNYRYAPPTWTLAQMVSAGAIGEVGQAKMDFYLGMDFKGGFRLEMEYPLLIDMAIHHFDLLRFITGLNPVRVSATAWNPPWSNYKGDASSLAAFEMENGARVIYNASWAAKGQHSDWNGNWQIEGDQGALLYGKNEITLYKVPSLYEVVQTESIPLEEPPALAQHYVLADFIDAVKNGNRPKTDVFDNIHSVSMVFAAVEAVKTGKTVSVLTDEVRELLQ